MQYLMETWWINRCPVFGLEMDVLSRKKYERRDLERRSAANGRMTAGLSVTPLGAEPYGFYQRGV